MARSVTLHEIFAAWCRFFIEEDQLKFPGQDQQLRNEVGSYVQELAEVLGLSGATDFSSAKVGI